MENSTPNKPVDQELKINLAALRKCDQFVLDILETSAQVALYKFDALKKEWMKTEIEGSLFLYRRSTLPKFALLIMNRLNRENLHECISKEMEFKVQKPFLLYKNASMDILGIWFNNPDKCEKVGELITGLYTSPRLQQTKAENNEKSILTMFANAQRKYEENKFQTKDNPLTSSQPQNTKIFGEKGRSKSLSTSIPVQPSTSLLLPAAVENEEAQPQMLHDPCIVKSSPVRPSSGTLSKSLPNSVQKTSQRQLFPLDGTSVQAEKVPFPSLSSQNSPGKALNDKPVMNQRSGSDINTAAALMSPLAFQSSKTYPSHIPQHVPEPPTLTKEQLQETLMYLLERDSDFLEKIHATYLKHVR